VPTVLGILSRFLLGEKQVERCADAVKLVSTLCLFVLCYANAAVCLPLLVHQPDWDFLGLSLLIVTGLCVLAFASGSVIGRLAQTGRPQRVSLMFGLGMNNNGTGLVLASMALGSRPIMMLPIIIRTTEEMIKLVPHSLREGSLALGSPEWKTALKVTFPAAAQGILTGILLGIARAAGETAVLLFTALGNDNYEVSKIVRVGVATHHNIFSILGSIINQPVDSLPLTLWKYAQQPYPERVNQAWAAALVLMILVLLTNIIARVWIQVRVSKVKG
jgi:ABC-type phosphate transport system permease subunit